MVGEGVEPGVALRNILGRLGVIEYQCVRVGGHLELAVMFEGGDDVYTRGRILRYAEKSFSSPVKVVRWRDRQKPEGDRDGRWRFS